MIYLLLNGCFCNAAEAVRFKKLIEVSELPVRLSLCPLKCEFEFI